MYFAMGGERDPPALDYVTCALQSRVKLGGKCQRFKFCNPNNQ